jgi:hypothetical protein
MVIGNGVATMTAIVERQRARATWLTGAAGMLMVAVAVAMMVYAAPRPHTVRPGPAPHDRLSSWVWVSPQAPAHRPAGLVAPRETGARP